MTVLIEKINSEGDSFLRRLHGLRPSGYNAAVSRYDYNSYDSVSEAHRKKDNMNVFRIVVRGLKAMQNEAENGFRILSGVEQKELIKLRKKQTRENLALGSFYIREMDEYIKKINNRIYKIYRPFRKY